jgi:hypothetical protein
MNPQIKEIITNYWGIGALLIWGGAILLFQLVSFQPYGIDEDAARGLLLNWSVADNIVNPIVVLGIPDLRALLYAPIGAYWSGSMVAAKVTAMIIMFLAATMLYRWTRRHSSEEVALISSALFLISPVALDQIDSLGAAPYLLLGFAVAAWLDRAYRAKPLYFGGWYFSQMLWVSVLFTIHPIAIVYPIALAWHWHKNKHDLKNSLHMYVGIAIAVILAISLKTGWENIQWFSNPIQALSTALHGGVLWSTEDINWILGIVAGVLLLIVIAADFRFFRDDFLGLLLLSSTLIGLVAADHAWAAVAVALIIYRGTHLLVNFNQRMGKQSFLGQRGLVTIIAFILATTFMMQAKTHHYTVLAEMLSPNDELIRELADIAADDSKAFLAASAWPGKTMLATRRDVMPLPPASDDPEEFLNSLESITHIIFDPRDPEHQDLANGIAALTGKTETVAYMKAGVIVAVRGHKVELRHYRPPVDTEDKSSEQAVGTEQAAPISSDT